MTPFAEQILGVVLAGAVGYLCQRAPVSPAVQSIGAALLGGLVALTSRSLLWILRNAGKAGVGAVSVGIAESLGGIAGLLVLALAGHWALGWLGAALGIPVGDYRPLILAILSGLCATLLFGTSPVKPETL